MLIHKENQLTFENVVFLQKNSKELVSIVYKEFC